MKEEDKQIQNEEYNEYVKQVTPTNNLFGNMVKAFIVGRKETTLPTPRTRPSVSNARSTALTFQPHSSSSKIGRAHV